MDYVNRIRKHLSEIDPEWKEFFKKFNLIDSKILTVYKTYGENIYPSNPFKAFTTPYDSLRGVIIGQDPYPTGATGYAFDYDGHKKSLSVIKNSYLACTGKELNTIRELAENGFLLLNTSLTFSNDNRDHFPMWKDFIGGLLKNLSQTKSEIFYLLWGNYAKKYAYYIHNGLKVESVGQIKPDNNYILESNHPMAEVYNKEIEFMGGNHFKIIENYDKSIFC